MGRPPAPIDPSILKDLAKKFSDEEIGEILGFARVTITAARKRHGIESFTKTTKLKKSNGQISFGGRKRSVLFNQNFFSCVDTEEKAYFLGLLAADGSISSRGHQIEITLADPDQAILYRFIKAIEGINCKVSPRMHRTGRNKLYYRLTLCSKQMKQDLVSWGLTPGKTEAFSIQKEIPINVLNHFIRGFWDGDGCIGKSCFEVGILSEPFTLQLQSWIALINGSSPRFYWRRTSTGKKFYVISVRPRKYATFKQKLYENSTVFLDRKYRKFMEFWS